MRKMQRGNQIKVLSKDDENNNTVTPSMHIAIRKRSAIMRISCKVIRNNRKVEKHGKL